MVEGVGQQRQGDEAIPGRGQPDAVLRGQPVRKLWGRPRALLLAQFLSYRLPQRRREAGRLTHVRLIRQRVTARRQEPLDPEAHAALALPQMPGDPRHTPADPACGA